MGLLDLSSGWLTTQMKNFAGVSVAYSRSTTAIPITSVVGRTVFASNQQNGPRIEFGERDYLVTAADISALGEPQIGDRITETVGGTTRVFEALTPSTGEPAWRWSDPEMTVYRIHVKQVA